MRDIEFRQVRSFEGLPDGGPGTEEQSASHTYPRFIDYVAELPKVRDVALWQAERRLVVKNFAKTG
jgi:hypothetical protein